MEENKEFQMYLNSKKLPKEYLILKLRMFLNKELYQNKTITFEIYNKMQKFLIKKMDKIFLESKT